MTENEAIKHLKLCKTSRLFIPNNDVLEVAINALEEIQQYRAIGTIEEIKALKEKSEPKKVSASISFFKCPCCGSGDVEEFYETGGSNKHNHCPNCGQKLDWQ